MMKFFAKLWLALAVIASTPAVQAQTTSVANIYRPASEGIRNFMTSAYRSEQSQVLQIFGDSTGDENDEWPYLFGQYYAVQFPNWAVVYHLWNDSTQDYASPLVISNGTDGERYIYYGGGSQTSRYLDPSLIGQVTGDLDVRVDLALDDWTPTSTTSVAGQWGGGTAKSWRFRVTSTGTLSLEYTPDGSAVTTATSSAIPSFTDGQRYRIRAVLDVDNGSSGRSVLFYTQAIGATTWTQLGTTQTTATAITLNWPSSQVYELGGTGSATSVISGKIYGFSIRQGIDGPRMTPALLEGWANADIASPIGGSPTLHIYNGSASGQGFAYFNNATRFPKMAVLGNHPALILSTGHNESALGSALVTLVDAFKTLVDARLPETQIIALTQNPRTLPTASEQFAQKSDVISRRIMKTGGAIIDTRMDFLPASATTLATEINPADGIHPIGPGRAIEGAAVWRAFASYVKPLRAPQ